MQSNLKRHDLGERWEAVARTFYVERLGDVKANHDLSTNAFLTVVEDFYANARPFEVYGITQDFVRGAGDPSFSDAVQAILAAERSAYRLIDGDTLVPFGSIEEADVLTRALVDAEHSGLAGAHKHLRESANELSSGNFASCVRESIHAVESALRSLSGESSVSKALASLSQTRQLHEAFKGGIKQLYGYGSNEPGVRHPLLTSGDAAVKEAEAMVMLGICAALVSYFSRAYQKPA